MFTDFDFPVRVRFSDEKTVRWCWMIFFKLDSQFCFCLESAFRLSLWGGKTSALSLFACTPVTNLMLRSVINSSVSQRSDLCAGDAAAVQESVAELERNLAAFDSLLASKHQEADVKEQQGNAFESAKTLGQLWLSQMEARLDEFEAVAIEVDIVEQQITQLQVKIYIFSLG